MLIVALSLLSSVSSADCSSNCQKMYRNSTCEKSSQCTCDKKTDSCEENSIYKDDKKRCDKCMIDDDEYCVYNECYFDKHYRKMKRELCLTRNQENCIDEIYKKFKSDMEVLHTKYRVQKNRLLEMIECENDCYKDEINNLKDIKRDVKELLADYSKDVKEQLCKNQYSDYRRFKREEKRKMKKIIKYGAVYKLPCVDCCSK